MKSSSFAVAVLAAVMLLAPAAAAAEADPSARVASGSVVEAGAEQAVVAAARDRGFLCQMFGIC